MGLIVKSGLSAISEYRNYVYAGKKQLLENFELSLRRAKNFFNEKDEELFGVIIVEGYPCIAYIEDEFTPIEISRTVFPYDGIQVYPMQAIKQTISFMNYRECMECEEWPPM